MMIWNIGYAGLDASMDFFYDGGKSMRPGEADLINNIKGISSCLESFKGFDFIMLQEVDRDSKRSYHIDQVNSLEQLFQGYIPGFGKNYDVFFVPIPISEPMGKVESGLLTLSKHNPSEITRHSFPGNYSWPMSLFMLDRCFLANRYPLSSGKELIVVNTHNSAYDDGTLREKQMYFMKAFLLDEFERGNYVIVGGDWNQTPPGFGPDQLDQPFDSVNLTYLDEDYPAKGWNWAFDHSTPSNRRVSVPYTRGSTLTTIIDGFLISPNIRVNKIRTHDVNFQFSDHQPVELHIELISN